MSATTAAPALPAKIFFLREWRIAKKLTQEQLAEQLGMHHTSLGKYERGEREPGPPMIARMADLLEISPGDLFRDPKTPSLDGLVAGLDASARAHITRTVKALADSYR
ncbi:helix-turn-helix domain-containing protein [Ancylobacter oerskovii]|uniref:Helix-turn-helix domain-containing protein n=1 Tax=Ancylobacter oerskovii TaxID=459519 RepID=A0ABW4YRR6_9HYPH|nr:helix-turn-helix transcriptional regulator [Ancylobacter oerskovii]MBS7545660.1 helix-turn-helix transcriptional regulator [Ancylobacter oerskovii]